jgi:signal peptidase I
MRGEERAVMVFGKVSRFRLIVSLVILVPVLGVFLAILTGSLQDFEVISSSMAPTLLVNDRVFLDKVAGYYPRRGEVVALFNPSPGAEGELLAKRVIGLPGDTVEIINGFLFLNGEEYVEPYLTRDNVQINVRDPRPVKVESDCAYVMGDNRNASFDSVDFGCVPVENIYGRLTYIYWPPGRMGAIR